MITVQKTRKNILNSFSYHDNVSSLTPWQIYDDDDDGDHGNMG
jgi:hypothetical protein